ncbi:MAG: phosphoglucosamine mutase [Fibrobacter sp.]|nr:phosphoglucosamine mutase [Fibrobacter sp.]
MSVLMRSVSGIRGIVGDTLTPTVLTNHVKAFLEVTGARKVVIGRDSRPTGEAIVSYVSGLCRLAGADVIDVGLATTPSVELYVTRLRADAGIIITASHNPLEWNALKFLDQKGIFLGPDEVKELFAIADSGKFIYPDYRQMGTAEVLKDADAFHIDDTLAIPFIDVEAIRAKHFKVAVDAVNGAGSYIVPRLLEKLGCEVVRINCTPDGTFPRGPEPIPSNLVDLGKAVRENHCAVGFAVDPDADRCALVDGNGEAIGEEYTLAIATEGVLSKKKGPVCVNLSTSRMSADVAEKFGVGFSRAKVGDVNVSLQMMQEGCVVGGEGNGGVILPALHYGRDSLVSAALVLAWMAENNGGPEKFKAEHPSYAMPKKKFPLGDKPVKSIFDEVAKEFSDWTADTRDGLWLGKDKCFVHVRASNTEPVIRVISEAPTEAEAEELCAKVEAKIK